MSHFLLLSQQLTFLTTGFTHCCISPSSFIAIKRCCPALFGLWGKRVSLRGVNKVWQLLCLGSRGKKSKMHFCQTQGVGLQKALSVCLSVGRSVLLFLPGHSGFITRYLVLLYCVCVCVQCWISMDLCENDLVLDIKMYTFQFILLCLILYLSSSL